MSRAPLQRGSPSEAIVEAARAAMNTTFFSAFPVQVRDRSHVGTADSPFMLVTVCGLRVWLRVMVWPSCVAVYVAAYIAVYMCGWLYQRVSPPAQPVVCGVLLQIRRDVGLFELRAAVVLLIVCCATYTVAMYAWAVRAKGRLSN